MRIIDSRLRPMVVVAVFLLTAIFAVSAWLPQPTSVFAAEEKVRIGETGYSTLEEAVAAAGEGDTLVLMGDLTPSKSVTIPAGKKLTFDLSGFTITSTADVPSGYLLSLSGDGSFSLKNGQMTASDVNGDGDTGGAVYVQGGSVALTVEGLEAYGFKSATNGGVLRAGSNKNHITLKECHLHDNRATSCGGAVYHYSEDGGSSVGLSVIQCIIENNRAEGSSAAHGGGISYGGAGSFLLADSTVKNNESYAEKAQWSGYNYSCGGGLCIDSGVNTPYKASIKLENNTIAGNKAQLFGGGIFFSLSEKKGDTLDLVSGLFENNDSGYAGGAIDYSIHGQPTLELRSAIITDNKAVTGGGMWVCPTSKTETYSTLGGAIIGNELVNKSHNRASGTDIRFEGSDTVYNGIKDSNDPSYHRMTISPRTCCGFPIHWYADEMGDLYQTGDPEAPSEYYTDRPTSFGLYGEMNEEQFNRTYSEANLIFRNNCAGFRGGAISANSDVRIGQDLDLEIKVTKRWLDVEGEPLEEGIPDAIPVSLWRIAGNGVENQLETVSLSKEKDWSHTFSSLPTKGRVHGVETSFTYEIREDIDVPGFDFSSKTMKIDGKHSEVVLTNQVTAPPGDLKVAKTVGAPVGSKKFNEEFDFVVTLEDETITGTYGDMEFTNGVARFKLKHGEEVKAEGLPAGAGYTVKEEQADKEGCATTMENATGTVESKKMTKVSFVNTFPISPSNPLGTKTYLEPPTPPTPSSQPKTGDGSNPAVYALVTLIAGTILMGLKIIRKHREF